MAEREPQPTVRLNALQWAELQRVEEGRGRYWPIGRSATLKALANRQLVDFHFGIGWCLTGDGYSVLKEAPSE